jgi:hypothetical protein
MPARSNAPSRSREWIILATGLASCLALCWSAWSVGDPSAGAEAEGLRRAMELEGELEDGWNRRMARVDWPATVRGTELRWTAKDWEELLAARASEVSGGASPTATSAQGTTSP